MNTVELEANEAVLWRVWITKPWQYLIEVVLHRDPRRLSLQDTLTAEQ